MLFNGFLFNFLLYRVPPCFNDYMEHLTLLERMSSQYFYCDIVKLSMASYDVTRLRQVCRLITPSAPKALILIAQNDKTKLSKRYKYKME